MIKILLLIDYSSEFDRKLLRGLVQYSKENGPWLFYRLPSYYSAMHGEQGILRWAKEWKADAIIGQWNNDTIDLQKELNIPVVLQNYHHRSVTYSNLTGDYKGTGRMAAQFFAKRMFRNFAYFGVKGVVWSDERCEGYRQEVKRIGGEFFSFESDKQEDEIRMEVSTDILIVKFLGIGIVLYIPCMFVHQEKTVDGSHRYPVSVDRFNGLYPIHVERLSAAFFFFKHDQASVQTSYP